jgi:PAS domain S-box-containing protein
MGTDMKETKRIHRVASSDPRLARPHDERDPILLPTLPAAWQCDLASEALTWSGGVFDLFGITRGTTIDRRSTLEFYLPESRSTLERLRSEALETCGSFTFEAQIRRMDGELRWMRVSADVQKVNGRAAVLYGTKRDITAEMAGYRDGQLVMPSPL